MGFFFLDRKDPKTELEGIERGQRLLNERFERKQVSKEVYLKQCENFRKQREKYEKKLSKSQKDTY